jgi:thymidine kinase
MSVGYLEIVMGPMFSGKTSKLIETFYQLKRDSLRIRVINYSLDTRYDDKNLSTHDQWKIPCEFVSDLKSLDVSEDDIILVNEAQFFPNLKETVLQWVEKENKDVRLYGLDGDFQRKPFGELLDLIPYSNNIFKLYARCHYCQVPAIYSHRVSQEKEQVVIGSDNYVPLCRQCFATK